VAQYRRFDPNRLQFEWKSPLREMLINLNLLIKSVNYTGDPMGLDHWLLSGCSQIT
jgi:hypothetical protein